MTAFVLLNFVFICIYLLFIGVAGEGSSEWVPSKNLESWLHPFDICLLKDERKVGVDVLEKDCKATLPAGSVMHPVRCRLGNTWPSRSAYCDSTDIPFAHRKHLKSVIAGYDDPNSSPLRDFFRALARQQGLLLLLGDSVTQQMFSALACELEREQVWIDPSQFTNTDELRTIAFPDINGTAAVRFLPMYHLVNGRYDRVPNATMTSLQTHMRAILRTYKTIVVLANMGLHYVDNPVAGFSKEDYRKQMTIVLTYLHTISLEHPSKQIHILWRETSAQHFPTSNGYWPGVKYASSMKLECAPIQDASPAADWRNRIVEHVVLRHNLFKVKILPFYNATLPLWSEHPNGQLRDCTHFCWSPFLYQPLFHALADTMLSVVRDKGNGKGGHKV
ncbi:hypothetical protein EON65_44585 [archaeon]|nr:MAG: hypothetical protein EON65_44585 [archaeon]